MAPDIAYGLDGRVAVVTGASRGIGNAIANRLVIKGCRVAGTCRFARPVCEINRAIDYYRMDVADRTAVKNAMDQIQKVFGRIDILVNNAGIARDNILARMSDEEWDDVLKTNLTGAFNCARAVIRYMVKARYGRIVNISSIVGLRGNAGQANYAASKAGLIGFTKSLAKEVASRGITCNAVCPGFIETNMTSGLDVNVRTKLLEEIPCVRFGAVDDVAHLVTFLCSDMASYITGQVFTVDGGLAI